MGAASHDVLLVHYNEIALKLGHRPMFVSRLIENVRRALSGLGIERVESVDSRLLVRMSGAHAEQALERLAVQPGIANILPAMRCDKSLEALDAAVERALEQWRPSGSFRVDVRRTDKNFPLKSPEIGARLGAAIVRRSGARVDLKHADEVVHVIVAGDAIYLSTTAKRPGCGGLPVSTGGRVLLLLSGGIDSPVAGLRMMRRGCRVDAVHFHSVPYLDRTSQSKARQLCRVLARGQESVRLSLVAFGDLQSEVVRSVPKPLRVVIYRRMMMRIASRIARLDHAAALVTGESLGQVASQTLANLSVIEAAAEVPLLRPLVGMDKLEITRYARETQTFDISVVPDQDCCTLFVPRHPATAATLEEAQEAERRLDVESLVERAASGRERERIEAVWGVDGEELAAAL